MNTTENKLHILLCEDEESLGMLVREYLQAKGYDAELFLDGEAGYKAFMKGKYDMCLLDVMMPKMDGFALAREIRLINADVPIIFLTARNLKDDILEGFKLRLSGWIFPAGKGCHTHYSAAASSSLFLKPLRYNL